MNGPRSGQPRGGELAEAGLSGQGAHGDVQEWIVRIPAVAES